MRSAGKTQYPFHRLVKEKGGVNQQEVLYDRWFELYEIIRKPKNISPETTRKASLPLGEDGIVRASGAIRRVEEKSSE